MNATFDPSLLPQSQLYLVAAAVAMARIGGLMAVFPGFTRLGLSGVLQGSVALVLTALLIPSIKEAWTLAPHSEGETALLMFKEVIVGTTLGLFLGAPFWAAELAGSLLDLQRASSMGNLVDPANVESANISPTLFVLFMLTLFYGAGGFGLVLETLYDSYALWPVGHFLPLFSANAGDLFLKLLDDIFAMGLMLIIPMVLILLLADVVLALVSRAAPNLHIFDLSLGVKNLIVALLMVPYLAFLLNYMGQDIGWLHWTGQRLEAIRGNP
jgi:type III secretion protein T